MYCVMLRLVCGCFMLLVAFGSEVTHMRYLQGRWLVGARCHLHQGCITHFYIVLRLYFFQGQLNFMFQECRKLEFLVCFGWFLLMRTNFAFNRVRHDHFLRLICGIAQACPVRKFNFVHIIISCIIIIINCWSNIFHKFKTHHYQCDRCSFVVVYTLWSPWLPALPVASLS